MEDILLQEIMSPVETLSLFLPSCPQFFSPWSTGQYLCYVRMTTNPSSQPPPPLSEELLQDPTGSIMSRVPRWRTSTPSPSSLQSPATLIIRASVDSDFAKIVFSNVKLLIDSCCRIVCLALNFICQNKLLH